MAFYWCLSESKSPQVSRTRLSILAVLNNSVVWMVSTHPPTSKSSMPFNNSLVTTPKALITIGKIYTFMYHSFFNPLARLRYLSFFSHSLSFILWSAGTAKSTILHILFFYYYYYHYHSLKVFNTSVSWWSFIGVWVTASLSFSLFSLSDRLGRQILLFNRFSYSFDFFKTLFYFIFLYQFFFFFWTIIW